MGNLNFQLMPDEIALGTTYSIQLWIQHDFPDALIELRFRLRGNPSIQILGQEQFRITRLERDERISVEVRVKGSTTGLTEITIDRISTRMSGRSHDFSPLKLPIQVRDHVFKPESLSLILLDAQSRQNAWSFLKLRLFNNNTFDLHQLKINFSMNNAQLNHQSQRIQMDCLAANQGADILVEFKPGQDGVFRIGTRIDAQNNHEPVTTLTMSH